MNAKKIFAVWCVFNASIIPSLSGAAGVERFSASGAYGRTYANNFDGCTYNDFYVEGSESTTKASGPKTPVPAAAITIYSSNYCTGEFLYWYGVSNDVAFSHSPATHNSFPNSMAMSGNVVLTDFFAGNSKTIHVELRLTSAGGQYETVSSNHYEYPSDDHTVKVDQDFKAHESFATGSLFISGDFQYTNASQSGYVGVSTTRSLVVVH